MSTTRAPAHEFSASTKETLAKRAAFKCSICSASTVGAAAINHNGAVSVGVAAHIHAASKGGPRYDDNLGPAQISNIANAIHLCATCSVLIDKNNGADYPPDYLRAIKTNHEMKHEQQLGRPPQGEILLSGTHEASGIGEVTALEINQSVRLMPGTVVRATGIGRIVGTKIGG